MKSTKISSLRNAALGLTLGALPFAVHAAALVNGTLTIKSGVRSYIAGVQSNIVGSWFGMDQSGSSTIEATEKTALQSGTAGIILGSAQAAGSLSHGGSTLAADTNAIDAPWGFFGNTGMHYTSSAITVIGGDTANGLGFSGWAVSWNGLLIPMGTDAWNGYVNGVAQFTNYGFHLTGTCGDPYRLNHYATVPASDPSFGGVKYQAHLEGFVFSGTCSGVVTTSPVDLAGAVDGSGATIAPAVIAANTTSISVTFNEAMDPASVTSAYMSVTGGVTPVTVTGNPTPSLGNTVFTFPVSGVAGGQTYTVTLGNGVTPVAAVVGHIYIPATAYARKFTTFVDNTPPTVVSTTPTDGATIAPNTGTVSVTFGEPVTNVVAGTISITGGVTVGAPTASNSNKTWTFPISGLVGSTSYTLSFNAVPTDPSGNVLTLPVPNAYTFTTLSAANPTLSSATSDKLLICPGSKFGMEVSPGNTIFTSITQYNPITIGVIQTGGGTHNGVPKGSETLAIDNAWTFFGNTGLHYTAAGVTDYGNGTLNYSGWRVHWNGISINMGGGLPATFTWDGVYGHNYTLTYLANVPAGDPSGFGGVLYSLNLTGKVNGGPTNVNAACDGATVTPSGVLIAVSGVAGATVALNSQIRPDDPALVAAGYSAAGRPDGYNFYKYGAITYTVSGLTPGAGQTATVTLTLPENVPTGSKIYKINSTGYHDITSQVAIAGATLTLNILDDGPLDDCKFCLDAMTGKAVIVDPIVIGVPIGTSADATGSATGGSGGCAYNPNGKFDLGMLLALFGSLGYLGWRRAHQ